MKKDLTEVTAETILSVDISKLQSYGMTFRKAEYITDFSEKVHSDAFNLDAVWQMTDEEAIQELSSLKGFIFSPFLLFSVYNLSFRELLHLLLPINTGLLHCNRG